MKKDTNLLNTQDVRAEAATALTPNATNGEKIKALRTAQGMSMAELSRRASMSDRAIRYIEAGEREPSVDAIQKIAAALGVTTDYFMDDATFQKELSDDQFYADVRKKYGSRGVAQAKKIKEQTSALFAGGELSEEDQANFIKEMENYLSRCVSFPESLWHSGSRQTVRGRAEGQGGQCESVKGSGTT